MDRFELIELDNSNQTPAPPAPQEQIVRADGSGRWGADTFHNLKNGARASGDVNSAHSLLGPADLDWDPEFRPLRTGNSDGIGMEDGQPVPDEIGRAVVRSDNGRPIGVVGARYQLIPHRKLADLADALCGAKMNGSELHFGNAGHKHNGARPFIQLKGTPRTIGANGVRDVRLSDVITLMTAHDGSLHAMACYGANIIVCDNTYAHALGCAKSRGVNIRHTASGIKTLDEAIRIARAASELGHSFDNAAMRLMVRHFDDAGMRALASALVPEETTRGEKSRGALMTAWASSAGAAPGTAWGAAQAVTWWTSHEIGVRNETDRAFGLATGEGRGADVQASAWWHLTTDEGAQALRTVKVVRC